MTKKSQNTRVLETLNTVGSITARRARSRGIQNLRARISELRDEGVNIESVLSDKKGDTTVKYVLNG